MHRKISLFVVAACLLFPTSLLAGGPPRLCLPIDGVTDANSQACADLLASRLGDKIWRHDTEIQFRKYGNQMYVAFFMGKEIALSDIEAGLKGTNVSVPRDKLRFFGHVVLKIDVSGASTGKSTENSSGELSGELLTGLKSLKNVAVAESSKTKEGLLVTLDMPYPAVDRANDRELVGWDSFRRNDLSTGSDRSLLTVEQLPGLGDLRDELAQHKARLIDVHWSPTYACRALGCAAAPTEKEAKAVSGGTP
jgi:hypothetical protein